MKQRIAIDPQIHFGKPCVTGTRIPVHNVLELIRDGLTFAQIVQDFYPDLEIEDVQACVQYPMDVVMNEEIHLSATP